MKGLVIFDLDGTLVDTPTGIVEAFQYAFKSIGEEIREPDLIKSTIGLPLEEAFGTLLEVKSDNKAVLRAIEFYQEAFRTIIIPKAKKLVFRGVIQGLVKLESLGYTIAIATSKYYKSADILLEACEIRNHFKLVMGADQVTLPKPNPEMGLEIMNRLGFIKEHTVMIGDTTHDILMANNIGIASIAVTYGVHSKEKLSLSKPTWIVNSFDEVISTITHKSLQNV